jgi:ADP-ribose pyrophosphatase YjhB (NUDIX family)
VLAVPDDPPILRPAARVLLTDRHDRVLLLRPNVGNGDVWITPGGVLEKGETAEQAARRELRDETGIESAELSPCVWTRVHRFDWGGQRYEQQERFFVARADAPAITLDRCGADELLFLSEWRWWEGRRDRAVRCGVRAANAGEDSAGYPWIRIPGRADRPGQLSV